MGAEGRKRFHIDADHPSLAGHFPGRPIVPGVVLLDELLSAIVSQQAGRSVCLVHQVKFLSPVTPGQEVEASWSEIGGKLRFEMQADSRPVASGSLRLGPLAESCE